MANNTLPNDTECISGALEILGDKWTPLLIKELTECPKKFSDLEKSLPGISPRTLSQRLNKLEQTDIITKTIYCPHPPRYKYALTKKGLDFQSILTDMALWSHKYSNQTVNS